MRKIKNPKVLIVVIIFILIGSSIVQGYNVNIVKESNVEKSRGILYVGGSGANNYTKIQDAINAASNGDTVFVYSGTYYENIVVDKSINLIGEDKNTTIIDGNEIWDVIYISDDYVNVSGFTIQNSDKYYFKSGININSKYVNVTNNYIENNFCGVLLYSSTKYIIIYLNVFSNNSYGVAFYYNSQNNFLCNNTFLSDGLLVFPDSYSNTIVNNTVNGKPLVYLENKSNKTISGIIGQLVLNRCDNITIQDKKIVNTNCGIVLTETHNCFVSNNILEFNTLCGLLIFYGDNNTILENIVNNNTNIGIQVWGNDNTIINNIFFNNGYGVDLRESNNSIVDNNSIFWNETNRENRNTCGIDIVDSSNNTINNNSIINATFGIELYDYSNYNTISRNKISQTYFDAIRLHLESGYNQVFKNYITNSYYGIDSTDSDNNIISENTIINCLSRGINIDWSNNNSIFRNNISKNEIGIQIDIFANNNIIKENTIEENNEIGINLRGINLISTTNNSIANNIISKSYIGINISGNSNTIYHNQISNNTYGINIWFGVNNAVTYNNFLSNNRDAVFTVLFKDCHNLWNQNYWNRPRLLPKLIFGGVSRYNPPILKLPWFNFDWYPSQELYDIPKIAI